MAPLLYHGAFVEYADLIAEAAGGKPVADVNRRLVLDNIVEFAVDFRLCDWVQGGGGLIQDDEGSVLVERPGKGDLLVFAAGHIHALLA